MATTVNASTLTVTITESLSVGTDASGSTDNIDFAQVNTHVISSSILNASKRIVELESTALTTVVTFDNSLNAGGQFKRADVKYIRITNLDDSAVLKVGLIGDSSGSFVSVAANTSIMFTGTEIEVGATFSSFANADSIKVIGAAQQQLEVFVATT
tara:strand:+ start:1154 stop:1621 length:468 start_codon:yes stop_codon:yes gene_type:complete